MGSEMQYEDVVREADGVAIWKPRFAAVPPDVRWRLRPTGGSTPNHSGATSLSWGIAPDSINSSRKDTALPHIGRHSRNYHSSAARTGPKNFLCQAPTGNYELDHQYSKKEYTAQLCL